MSDILDEPICFINYLVDAKVRLKEAQDTAATNKVKTSTTDISEISKNIKKIRRKKEKLKGNADNKL